MVVEITVRRRGDRVTKAKPVRVSDRYAQVIAKAVGAVEEVQRTGAAVEAVMNGFVAAVETAVRPGTKAAGMLTALAQSARADVAAGLKTAEEAVKGVVDAVAEAQAIFQARTAGLRAGAEAGKVACVVDGVEYDSLAAVARAFGFKVTKVQKRLDSPYYPTWHRKGEIKPYIERPRKGEGLRKPVMAGGVYYPSIKEAAAGLGCSVRTVHTRMATTKADRPRYATKKQILAHEGKN